MYEELVEQNKDYGKTFFNKLEERKPTIKLNPDVDFVKEIKKALKDNSGYCPCSIVKNEDTKCMCREFREMDSGMCHCGLYIKE